MKYDIFISYRRDGGEYTAKIIRDRLEALGYHVFFDVESLRSGDFNTRLYSVIDECRDFLIIMSPGCLTRCAQEDDWVRRELEYALAKEKNIIPVLLRGFTFPDTLPASLEPIRFKNGIEANSEFFDAFLDKLQSFLETRPTLLRRISKNPIFRRTLPFLLAIILFAAGAYGVSSCSEARKGIYPRTQEEINTVNETLYYIESNLTCINLMLKEYYSVLDACDNYLVDRSTSAYNAAVNCADNAWRQIGKVDFSPFTISDTLSQKLDASPFSKADLLALQTIGPFMQEDFKNTLLYLKWLISSDCALDINDRRQISSLYRKMTENTASSIAYGTNELLLAVTADDSLTEFKRDFLPTYTNFPFSSQLWIDDSNELRRLEESADRANEALADDLSIITGNLNVDVAEEKSAFIEQLMKQGYTREEAEEWTNKILSGSGNIGMLKQDLLEAETSLKAMQEEAREKFAPEENDEPGILWGKALRFANIELYEEAVKCVQAYQQKVRADDPAADIYCASAVRFFRQIWQTGIDYGMLILGPPEGESCSPYQIGDILVAINQNPCHNFEEYSAIDRDNGYEATVLRPAEDGTLVLTDLTIEAGRAPRSYMLDMTEKFD